MGAAVKNKKEKLCLHDDNTAQRRCFDSEKIYTKKKQKSIFDEEKEENLMGKS